MRNVASVFILGVAVSLLSGCLAGAVVAGGAATGSIASDNRSLEAMGDDSKIAYHVNQFIASDKVLAEQAHISAVSYNRIVLLVGQAPNADLQDRAVALAQRVPNIRRIFNQIRIAAPTSLLTRSKDTSITANVKGRMLATTNLKAGRFKVLTENGTVYLLGLATRQQSDIAATVARNSAGVKQVVKLIEYLDEE